MEQIPFQQNLRAKDVVVPNIRTGQIKRRLSKRCREPRPSQHGHAAQIDEVAAAGDDRFAIRDRLSRDRIGTHDGSLGQFQTIALQPVTRHTHTTAGDCGVDGREVAAIDLLHHLRFQSHRPRIFGNRCDRLSIQHHADFLGDVVVHRFGVDDSVTLLEHDVAFEIYLSVVGFEILDPLKDVTQSRHPSDDPIG